MESGVFLCFWAVGIFDHHSYPLLVFIAGLFQKAIMESGVSLCLWAVGYPRQQSEPKRIAAQFGTLVGCDGGDSQRLLACLRTKDAEQIANASSKIFVRV